MSARSGLYLNSLQNSSADNLLSLLHKIPDYAEIRHLKKSEFVKALENLKEEFRKCRASACSSSNNDDDDRSSSRGASNHLLSLERPRNTSSYELKNYLSVHETKEPLLRIKGYKSQLHLNSLLSPTHNVGSGSTYGINCISISANKSARSCASSLELDKLKKHGNLLGRPDDDDKEEGRAGVEEEDDESSNTNSSHWSSRSSLDLMEEFCHPTKLRKDYDYVPPRNVEKRILRRSKPLNSDISSSHLGNLMQKVPKPSTSGTSRPATFSKAHPVPTHVYKPLYEFIVLKNQRRSQKIREQSKARLMAQVMPFSFSRDVKLTDRHHMPTASSNNKLEVEKPVIFPSSPAPSSHCKEVLNNTRLIKCKSRSTDALHRQTLSNDLRTTINHFKANPAPPRTKALVSAMKLKEQQEYRELKKRLRAEALLKNASLPPSMAARDKNAKLTNAKLDALIREYHHGVSNKAINKYGQREQCTDLEDDSSVSIDSENSYFHSSAAPHPSGALTPIPNHDGDMYESSRRKKGFPSVGKSRNKCGSAGIFECTSNDNLASKLRIQATRRKEAERTKKMEEEMLKLMKIENRRKKLRDWHIAAWKRAHSYTSNQDIAMRRQLRMATAILERESFVRDMSSMLCRVRSAPLLLEGVRERRFEPCKQHKDEFVKMGYRSLSHNNNAQKRNKKHASFDQRYSRHSLHTEDSSDDDAVAEGPYSQSDSEEEDEREGSKKVEFLEVQQFNVHQQTKDEESTAENPDLTSIKYCVTSHEENALDVTPTGDNQQQGV